ncbi:conserved hypothetical protein [Thiomonas sp. X19]|uniref:DUF2905 domain-containing protein n=1 Tax=Thiomonas sp. X19 TaxID=1050370 RepID=UPI000B6366D1|nr:DUF2905 domain-containing protein [Thiomonas sp. X19]SCC92366.1 conserved hypothetical protein [Thiomonas sp. X19]
MWLFVFILASIVVSALLPYLERFGFGRLPLDLRFQAFGREWLFPLGSALLLSIFAWVMARLLR